MRRRRREQWLAWQVLVNRLRRPREQRLARQDLQRRVLEQWLALPRVLWAARPIVW
jgi:hypothetical protein